MSHILVVDDNQANLYYLEALLTGHGHTVEVARHGADALALAQKNVPDAIVSDLLMPVMDGYTLLRECKADPALAAIPFIVYTATYTEPEDERLALDLGADAFLLKPMEPEYFLTGLHSALERGSQGTGGSTRQEAELLKTYSEALVRKLEGKTLKLEQVNRALQEDIERREKVEKALRISEERFRLLVKATCDTAWDWDLASNQLWWTGNFTQMFGYSPPETLDYDAWRTMIHPDDREAVARTQLAMTQGAEDSWLVQYRLRHADGSWINVEDRGHLLRDPEGKPTRMMGGLTNIMVRKALEEQVRRAQRMDAVGQLTGGVAHDFNNLLTVVLGNAHDLVEKLETQPSLQDMARLIYTAAERGSNLTRRLLAFARKQALSPQPVNINLLMHDMLPLLQRAVGGNIEIEQHQNPDIPLASVDPGQLEHALLNLCINSRDAMPKGGKLVLASDSMTVSGGRSEQELAPGQYVVLSVSDTGTGIAPDHLDRIFEPFYSTKPEGNGAGLGLPMVYGFVRQSGGMVNVRTELGKGTTFSLILPATGGDVCPPPPSPVLTGDNLQGNGEHILLVEDDDLIRNFARGQLESLGYRVTAVASGQEALALLAGPEPVDLLFTDIVMPTLSGPELVHEAHSLRPGLAVLFTTGFAGNGQQAPAPGSNDLLILYKPYRRDMLAKAIRQALIKGR